jgi:hypothetical protein
MTNIDGWISIEDYCAKYGERENTILKRVADDQWERGREVSTPDTGGTYLHEQRAVAWLTRRGKLRL